MSPDDPWELWRERDDATDAALLALHYLAGTPPSTSWLNEVVLFCNLWFEKKPRDGGVRAVLSVPPSGQPMPLGRAGTILCAFLAQTRIPWRSPFRPLIAYM